MIDLHIHVLPGLDDGPSELDDAVRMCRMCEQEGILTLVATPHVIPGLYETTRDRVLAAIASLQGALRAESSSVRVLPGADIRVEPDLLSGLISKRICTIADNGVYVLLEVPETVAGLELVRLVSGLRTKGLRPIVSHPERSRGFQADVRLLYNLVHSDVLLQLTAASLLGSFGKEVMDFSKRLLEHGLVHILASDAHSPTERPPGLAKAVEKAAEIIGEEEACALVTKIPEAVVKAEPVRIPLPRQWKEPKKLRLIRWVMGS